jgi:hypothetical protein
MSFWDADLTAAVRKIVLPKSSFFFWDANYASAPPYPGSGLGRHWFTTRD